MSLKAKIFVGIERMLALFTDKIVCISEAEKKSALTKHIAKESQLELIPNGIIVSAVRDAKPFTKEELGFPPDSYVVGMIGRLDAQKAPDTFIKAGKLIKDRIPNAVFIIVGNGKMTDEVNEFANKNGLKLIVTGWVENPYSYLKMFDVALLLSRWEGFGLAIVEYMAAEKNVVASRVDAIPTLIENKKDGLLVEVDNPTEVAEKVIYLYTHPDDAKIMRENALVKVRSQFDISRVAKQHMEMFDNLLKT